jgi:hypothetical protein
MNCGSEIYMVLLSQSIPDWTTEGNTVMQVLVVSWDGRPEQNLGFHPAGRKILKVLPIGSHMTLVSEPSNQYDPNAILVEYDMRELPVEIVPELDKVLEGTDFTASELCTKGILALGYLAGPKNKNNKGMASNIDVIDLASRQEWGLMDLHTTFAPLPNGMFAVKIEEQIEK